MINLKDVRGITPLSFALYSKKLPLIQYLVENGADVNTVTMHSGNIMDIALNLEEKSIIDYLASKGAKAFDSGYNKIAAEALKKYLTDNYKNPLNYIINSHTDGDHVAGNKIYPNDKLVIVCRSVLESNPSIINAKKSSLPHTGRSGKSFDTYYTTNLNGEELIIIPYPGIHGNEDIVVHFTKSKVIFAGDLLLSQCFPAIRNTVAYFAFLEKLIDVLPEDTIFVSGHGKNINHSELKKYYSMLKESSEIVRTHFSKTEDLNTMLNEKILKVYDKDYSFLSFLASESWIRTVFGSLQNKSL
jgi:glyoxylase-like metal-dependent hydrolase (beta-lactamase superfamily II)